MMVRAGNREGAAYVFMTVNAARSVLAAGHYLGRPTTRIETRHSTVVESTYAEGARLPMHAHMRPHLCLVIHGGYEERLGGDTVVRHAGAVSFLPAGCSHAERHLTAGRHLMVETTDAVLDDVGLVARVPTSPVTIRRRSASRLASRLLREVRQADGLTPLIVDALVVELLGELCRERRMAPASGDWVGAVRDLLETDPLGPHDLARLGRAVNRHPVHVARCFRQRFGMSVGTYLRRRRVLWAVARLQASDDTVAEVAAVAGFSDQSHFARWCRTYLGHAPAQIKRR